MPDTLNPHHTPEILALMEAVEKRFDRKPETSTQFISLSIAIKTITSQNLSESTLKRLWGYVNNSPAPRVNTLDILAQYVGHRSFRAFCENLRKEQDDSSAFFKTSFIVPEELSEGAQVEIGWAPDRLIVIEYLGDYHFRVVSAKNSKLQPGDEFEATSLMTGYPLYLSGVLRNSSWTTPFVGGKNGGLTIVRKI